MMRELFEEVQRLAKEQQPLIDQLRDQQNSRREREQQDQRKSASHKRTMSRRPPQLLPLKLCAHTANVLVAV